jgi:DNA (cytosine-5)-methyltransferase 1
MAEIAAVPWNGLKAVSTFSGAGGSCLGYRWAGFRVLWASEFIPRAQACYRANHPTSILDGRDVRDVKASEILSACELAEGELDLFDGSPPCSGFSTAGKKDKGWGTSKVYSDTKQRVDDLFFEYIRLVRGVQPKVFVAENVPGLVRGTAKGYFKEILRAMKAAGYTVEARLMDGQFLGVPQLRKRLFFMGVREDLGLKPSWPAPQKRVYSVRDAIEDLSDEPKEAQAWITMKRTPSLARWLRLPPGKSPTVTNFQFLRCYWDRPAFTFTTKPSSMIAGPIHPSEDRSFTIAEFTRLMGFPDDFDLSMIQLYSKKWERLARAVPPPMSRALGLAAARVLEAARAT